MTRRISDGEVRSGTCSERGMAKTQRGCKPIIILTAAGSSFSRRTGSRGTASKQEIDAYDAAVEQGVEMAVHDV
jgi:hypothetical protein